MLDELPEIRDITLSDMEEARGVMGRSIMNQSLQKLAQKSSFEMKIASLFKVNRCLL